MNIRLLNPLILCLLTLLLVGFETASFALPQDSIRLETFDGGQLSGTLKSIDEEGTVSGKNLPDGLKIKDILSINNSDAQPSTSRPVKIMLTGGGIVFASEFMTDGVDADIISKTVVGKFALETTQAVIWRDSQKVQTALKNRSGEFDQVVVDTGEEQVIVSGLLERITEEKVELNYQGESRKINRSIVLAIVTADLQPRSPKGTIGTLELTDGSIVKGGIQSYQSGAYSILLDDRNAIRIAGSRVKNVSIKSDRIVFASDLTPTEVDQRSYFGIERAWQMDKSVEGNPLTLKSDNDQKPLVFKRGIGTQSYSRLVFEVPEGFDRFAATVGIDTETGNKGDCELVVSGDGIQLWQGRVRAGIAPQRIDIDITGTNELTLTVRPGNQFDLSDHVNWCNARFLNTK